MAELISKEEVLNKLDHSIEYWKDYTRIKDVLEVLKEQISEIPSAKAQWLGGMRFRRCSNCGLFIDMNEISNYCGRCGSQMTNVHDSEKGAE